jgi:cation:H+ antiporter
MAAVEALALFLVSLPVTLLAAQMFARRLDHLGVRFGFPEAMIGLLTALAADGPEISSALFALAKGAHSASVGVLVGSNAFNLAAMVGLTGVLAGSVLLPREALWLEGAVGAAVTGIASALLLGWIAPAVAALLAAAVVAPYLTLLIRGSELLAHGRHLKHFTTPLERALAQRPGRQQSPDHPAATHHLLGLVVMDVLLIVAGSAGMVQGALTLGDHWHIPAAVLGTLVLAPLTSIPNAVTGVRLGLAGRHAALVAETFNSNTINLGVGVVVPALFVALGSLTATATWQLMWLIAMTVVCLGLLAGSRGLRRAGGLGLIAMYLCFVALQVVGS